MMRWLLLGGPALALVGLVFWAYDQNYRTQQALREAARLQVEIGDLRERLSVLRAEWAYLNRPDRLQQLADINFDRLHLLQLMPEHFGQIDQIGFPSDLGFPEVAPIDLAAILDDGGDQ